MRVGLIALALGLTLAVGTASYAEFWEFPPLPPPDEYGNIIIDRTSTASGVKPVHFSHWIHRLKYTCRVCHFELEFEFKKNATEITEADNKNGHFCGACHDGIKSFGHTPDNCNKCHSNKVQPRKPFGYLLAKLPLAKYGNQIDWVSAAKITKPVYGIFKKEHPFRFEKTLTLKAEWDSVPPAIFPHKPHARLLDCSNCHPDIFNIKAKTTKHFAMDLILNKQFCGVCHYSIAFPINDCRRCHPDMKEQAY